MRVVEGGLGGSREGDQGRGGGGATAEGVRDSWKKRAGKESTLNRSYFWSNDKSGLPEPEPPFLAGAGADYLVRLKLRLQLLL